MMKLSSRISLLLICLVLGAWIVACSSDDNPTGTGAGDTTPPTVTSVQPSQDATGVGLSSDLVVTFSEPMTALTNMANVTLSAGSVTGLSWDSETTLRVTHSAWANGTNVTATLGTAFSDTTGNGLATPYIWDFWTVTTTPQVLGASVPDGATNVTPNASITFLFTAQMDLTSLGAATTITDNGAAPKLAPGASWSQGDGTHAILSFDPPLDPFRSYTIDIAATAQTLQGTSLGAAFQLNFSTGSADDTPPNLVSIVPSSGSTIPASTSQLVMTFDEAIDPNYFDPSMLSGQFQEFIAVNGIDPTWSVDGDTLTVPLPTPLPAGMPIVVQFDSYQDLAGNVQTTPIDYRVDVAGTPSYWPAIGGEMQGWFETWNDQPTNGQPDSGSGSFYRRYEVTAGDDFDMADYGDLQATMPWSTDHYRMTPNGVRLLGFSDFNNGIPSNTTLSPSVDYMRLPVKIETWSGTTTATSPDGTATIDYTVNVLGQEDVPYFLPNKAAVPQPTISWVDSWKATLNYEFKVGGATVQSGVDTLWYAPATGLVQRVSHETGTDGTHDSSEKYYGPAALLK